MGSNYTKHQKCKRSHKTILEVENTGMWLTAVVRIHHRKLHITCIQWQTNKEKKNKPELSSLFSNMTTEHIIRHRKLYLTHPKNIQYLIISKHISHKDNHNALFHNHYHNIYKEKNNIKYLSQDGPLKYFKLVLYHNLPA